MQNPNQPYQMRVDKDRRLLDLSFPEMDGKPYTLLTFSQAKSLAKDILRVIRDETADSTNVKWQKDLHDIRDMLERAFGPNH